MSSVTGCEDKNKQLDVAKVLFYRKENVQTDEVKDFLLKNRKK